MKAGPGGLAALMQSCDTNMNKILPALEAALYRLSGGKSWAQTTAYKTDETGKSVSFHTIEKAVALMHAHTRRKSGAPAPPPPRHWALLPESSRPLLQLVITGSGASIEERPRWHRSA